MDKLLIIFEPVWLLLLLLGVSIVHLHVCEGEQKYWTSLCLDEVRTFIRASGSASGNYSRERDDTIHFVSACAFICTRFCSMMAIYGYWVYKCRFTNVPVAEYQSQKVSMQKYPRINRFSPGKGQLFTSPGAVLFEQHVHLKQHVIHAWYYYVSITLDKSLDESRMFWNAIQHFSPAVLTVYLRARLLPQLRTTDTP